MMAQPSCPSDIRDIIVAAHAILAAQNGGGASLTG